MRMFLSTLIDASQESVFAAASDFPNAANMIGGINSVEMLSKANNGSDIGVGTRFKESRTMMGKEAVEEMEVTEFDPPRAYTLSAMSCGVKFDSRVTCLEETPGSGDQTGGCRLSYDIDTEPQTLFAKVVSPIMGVMMKGTMRKAMEKDLADMKEYLESPGSSTAGGVPSGG
ncbi:MAG: SRPBCC family protein [Phycisphaera sp.]|nr:MAG: SRPBCC family protein [Phycisphaera sp.]